MFSSYTIFFTLNILIYSLAKNISLATVLQPITIYNPKIYEPDADPLLPQVQLKPRKRRVPPRQRRRSH